MIHIKKKSKKKKKEMEENLSQSAVVVNAKRKLFKDILSFIY